VTKNLLDMLCFPSLRAIAEQSYIWQKMASSDEGFPK